MKNSSNSSKQPSSDIVSSLKVHQQIELVENRFALLNITRNVTGASIEENIMTRPCLKKRLTVYSVPK